jgi:hypothetical protein
MQTLAFPRKGDARRKTNRPGLAPDRTPTTGASLAPNPLGGAEPTERRSCHFLFGGTARPAASTQAPPKPPLLGRMARRSPPGLDNQPSSEGRSAKPRGSEASVARPSTHGALRGTKGARPGTTGARPSTYGTLRGTAGAQLSTARLRMERPSPCASGLPFGGLRPGNGTNGSSEPAATNGSSEPAANGTGQRAS